MPIAGRGPVLGGRQIVAVTTSDRAARRGETAGPSEVDGRSAGTIRPHRALPGGRALVGALLVTGAAVALFASYTNSATPSKLLYLVAARSVRAGQVLTDRDLRRAPMDLPEQTAARAFTSPSQVEGRVALGPLRAGELVDRSTVPAGSATGTHAQLSIALDIDRTVDGTLQAGDLVDVLVTYGTGTGSMSQVVATRAKLLDVPASADAELGGRRRQTLTLEVSDLDDALHLVNATRAGEVTLVRTTGFQGREYTSATFSPEGADGAAGATTPSTSGGG